MCEKHLIPTIFDLFSLRSFREAVFDLLPCSCCNLCLSLLSALHVVLGYTISPRVFGSSPPRRRLLHQKTGMEKYVLAIFFVSLQKGQIMSFVESYCTKITRQDSARSFHTTPIFIYFEHNTYFTPENAYLHFDIFLGVTLLMDFYALLM